MTNRRHKWSPQPLSQEQITDLFPTKGEFLPLWYLKDGLRHRTVPHVPAVNRASSTNGAQELSHLHERNNEGVVIRASAPSTDSEPDTHHRHATIVTEDESSTPVNEEPRAKVPADALMIFVNAPAGYDFQRLLSQVCSQALVEIRRKKASKYKSTHLNRSYYIIGHPVYRNYAVQLLRETGLQVHIPDEEVPS